MPEIKHHHHHHHHHSRRSGGSRNKSRSQKKGSLNGKNFIILPIVFCVLIYLICAAVDCQIRADLYFGDSWYVLGNGVGIYNGSAIPGYGRTVLIAGHNNTYFNGLKYAEEGQIIKIRTNYGNYKYEITGTKITDCEDRSAYDLNKNEENIILYTCYPFDTLGLTNLRAFIYAKYVSGPMIDKNS